MKQGERSLVTSILGKRQRDLTLEAVRKWVVIFILKFPYD